MVLGVDVGGVIIARVPAGDDTSFFGSQPMLTPAVDGAAEALALLRAEPFEGRVHLVSTAGPRVEARTRAWLGHHGFFARTGIPAGHLHFVRKRADKAPVCRRLGVTHFVDDHLDVLRHLTTVTHRLLFTGGFGDTTGSPAAAGEPGEAPSWATVVDTWAGCVEAIRRTGTAHPAGEAPPGR